MNYIGDYDYGAVVQIPFNTFSSDDPSISVTITDLINTDVHIHAGSDLTQRNNAAGVTVDVDVDAKAGNHLISIDTADNTVANFFVPGKDYEIRIEEATVDGGNPINAWVGHFSIENRHSAGKMVNTMIATLASQTEFTLTVGSADNDAYNNCIAIITDRATPTQKAVARILDYNGGDKTVTLASDPGIFTMAQYDNISIVASPMPFLATKEQIATQVSTQFGVLKNAEFTFTFEMQLLNGNPATGITVTEEVSKNAGAYAAAAGTASEISDGTYKMIAAAADMNATVSTFRFTSAGCKETKIQIKTGT